MNAMRQKRKSQEGWGELDKSKYYEANLRASVSYLIGISEKS